MKPIEFVLWLSGAAELVGDQPPTPEQWATMRDKLGEAVGGIVAARLLERAEEALRADERRKEAEAEKDEAMKQMRAYQASGGLETQKLGLAGIILEVPEPPRPSGFLNRILAKAST